MKPDISARLASLFGMFFACALVASASSAAEQDVQTRIHSDMALAKAFRARSAWHLVVTQGPPVDEASGADLGPSPGAVTLCLRKAVGDRCDPGLRADPSPADSGKSHFLDEARLVYPRGKSEPPLLLLRTATLAMFNGDQGEFTQLFAYRPASDRFEQVYRFVTSHNNNQEVRFVASGPLAGSMISADPTGGAPFGYWVTVSRLDRGYRYRQVLRYRSATRYADGNRLAVIDSEMPNIQQRLGLWKPGAAMPLPTHCPHPRLIHTALWCN